MNNDLRETVLEESNPPQDRILFVEVEDFDVSKIVRGVVTIYAVWSGTSHMAWRHLTSILSRDGSLPFFSYVIDADDLTPEFADATFSMQPHGDGESFWVRDGKIVKKWNGWKSRNENLSNFTRDAFE
jgi:hypothetical protein